MEEALESIFASTRATRILMRSALNPNWRKDMLWTIFVILLVLWLLGAFVVPVGGSLIHLLLVIALIVLIYNLVTGRRGI